MEDMVFLHRVVSLSLNNKVRASRNQDGLSIELILLHRNKSLKEQLFLNLVGFPWLPSFGGAPGTVKPKFPQ